LIGVTFLDILEREGGGDEMKIEEAVSQHDKFFGDSFANISLPEIRDYEKADWAYE
jgi:hypothetical protein